MATRGLTRSWCRGRRRVATQSRRSARLPIQLGCDSSVRMARTTGRTGRGLLEEVAAFWDASGKSFFPNPDEESGPEAVPLGSYWMEKLRSHDFVNWPLPPGSKDTADWLRGSDLVIDRSTDEWCQEWDDALRKTISWQRTPERGKKDAWGGQKGPPVSRPRE